MTIAALPGLWGASGRTDKALAARLPAAMPHRAAPRILHSGDYELRFAGALRSAQPLAAVLERVIDTGATALDSLRGDFVLALHAPDKLLLMRDGAGARTLYWTRHQGRVIYASEPKALWSLPGFSRRIRPAALAQYFSMSFVPAAGTMLEDVFELEAGQRLEFVPIEAPPKAKLWCRFECTDRAQRDDCEWIGEFRDLHARAVEARLPDSPPALFLSGGIDSSVVAAEVNAQSRQPVHTFAVHFGRKYPNELEFAAAVAKQVGTVHHEVEIRTRDFLPRLREIVWHLDDPIGDPVAMPNYELARHVAGLGFTHVFNGEGGDPLFGGPKNLGMMLHHWYDTPGMNREQRYLSSYRRGYDILTRLLTPDLQRGYSPQTDLEGVLRPFFTARQPASLLNKLMAMNIRLKGAHLILPKVERMLAAAGLVPLSPLFDETLLTLSFAMPERLKLDRATEKVILKRAYAQRLPKAVIDRPKSGMRVPVHYWFQGEMRRYARHLLQPKEIRRAGLFDPDTVSQLLKYNLAGEGRYGIRLWMLVTFEIWRRIVIEGEPL